jgi:hypothetical protein
MLTASAVVQLLFSQIRETSSSVGPMPEELAGDSEVGKQPLPLLFKMMAGEVVIGSFGEFEIPK